MKLLARIITSERTLDCVGIAVLKPIHKSTNNFINKIKGEGVWSEGLGEYSLFSHEISDITKVSQECIWIKLTEGYNFLYVNFILKEKRLSALCEIEIVNGVIVNLVKLPENFVS